MAQRIGIAENFHTNIQFTEGYFLSFRCTWEWRNKVKYCLKIRDTDIIISSFIKSGTHWLLLIAKLLVRQERLKEHLHTYQIENEPVAERTPEQESNILGKQTYPILSEIENEPNPRFFITHMPFHWLPDNPNAKYIYILRNPKDVVVSDYEYFTHNSHLFYYFKGSFNDFFDYFIDNKLFGYCDQVKSYFSHKERPNLLIVTYEELQTNFSDTVGLIAAHLNIELTQNLFKIIEEETTKERMREILQEVYLMEDGYYFVRKCKSGDWRERLSAEQARRMNNYIKMNLPEEIISRITI